jgi:hypothetical protein
MTKKTAMWTRTAMLVNVGVGILWIGIGLRDLFAPGLFSFSPTVASNSTIVLDFAAGAAFLFCAFCLRQAKPTAQ